MTRPTLPPVEQQLRRVTRRLLVQTFLDRLVWCWTGALGLAGIWLLLGAWLPEVGTWLDWAGLMLLATCLAVGLAFLAVPSRLAVALAVDERFNLRERVTTSLSLPPEQQDSPAARALLDDVNLRVARLDVPAGFPVRLSRSAVLVPLAAAGVAVIAFLGGPGQGSASTNSNDPGKQAAGADTKELQQKLDAIKKQLAKQLKEQPKSAKLEELEKLFEKLLNQPLDPNDKEKLRERIKEMQPLQKRLKERMADLRGKADRAAQMREALKDLKALDGKAQKGGPKEGKELAKALARGDFQRAAEEVERLRKKMQKDDLKPEERAQLEKEMRDLERQLKRLGDMQDLRDRLKEALDKGDLEREQFDQQMQELEQMAGDLQDLQDLAEALGECLQCLKKGDKLGAGKKLKLLAGKLARLDAADKELKGLEDNEDALKEAQEALLLALRGGKAGGNPKQGNGLGAGRLPGRQRPITKKGPADFNDGRQRVPENEKGQRYISGFRKGGTFSKIPAREVGGTFRQAQQDAPAAMERQRVPPDAGDIIKGYFEALGGQK
jgi:uncharacterized coiled-coil DUF342 family protein